MEIDRQTEIDLWHLMANCFRFFKRRIRIILSFLLIGFSYSISNFFTHPLVYRSFFRQEFIARSSVITDEILSDIINAIPVNVTNDKNRNFPDFRSVKGKLITNKNKETRLNVCIEAPDSTSIDSMLIVIGFRVSAINILKKKYDFAKKQNQQLLAELQKQLTETDPSKNNPGNSNQVELMEKKQSIEKNLAQNKIIEFIPINDRPILVSNTRDGVLNILGYSFLGLVMGFIIAWLLDFLNRKK